MKTLAIAVATFGLATTSVMATPALAQTETRATMKVSTAGLDLNTLEGQEILDARIERAAREVCEFDRVALGTRIVSSATRECVAKARASAEQQVASLIEDQRRGG